MNQGFYRELKRYTLEEIAFIVTGKRDITEQVRKAINTLRRYGILKAVKNTAEEYTSLENEDIILTETISDSSQVLYSFDFVGVIMVESFVFKVYPKYIDVADNLLIKFKQVLRIIEKYNNKNQIIYLHNGEDENTILNKLALELFLLLDYFMNGLYDNEREIIEVNGTGEISWDKTINEAFTFIKNNKPYYFELYTRDVQGDEENYFRRLHQCILTKISKELSEAGILELFDIDLIELTGEVLDDFGDTDTLIYRLARELRVQFVTRKQQLLKSLIVYLDTRKAGVLEEHFSLYGTNSFYQIWEEVCQEAFSNMLGCTLEALPTSVAWTADHKYFNRKNEKLIEIIEHPTWHKYLDEKGVIAPKTLIPDIVSVFPYKDDYCFGIFDAKYYNISFLTGKGGNKNYVTGQPGISDITKQYLYQLAYMEFISEQKYKFVTNMFLCPYTLNDKDVVGNKAAINYGYVELNMLHNLGLKRLENILVIKLPAEHMYDFYLRGNHIENIASFLPEQTVNSVDAVKPLIGIQDIESGSNTVRNADHTHDSLFAANYSKYQYPKEIVLKFQERLIYEMLYDLIKDNMYLVSDNDYFTTYQKVADPSESSAVIIRRKLAEVSVAINKKLSKVAMVELDDLFEKMVKDCICTQRELKELLDDTSKFNYIVTSLKDMYLDIYN